MYVKTLGVRNFNFEAVPEHFRVRDHPYSLQNYLPTLRPSCSQHISMQLRHGPKARYGWMANPYRKPFLAFSRQGLSPCKIRRALLDAITFRITCTQSQQKLWQIQFFIKCDTNGKNGSALGVSVYAIVIIHFKFYLYAFFQLMKFQIKIFFHSQEIFLCMIDHKYQRHYHLQASWHFHLMYH